MARYYHRTPEAAAILRDGFRDGEGSYGLATLWLTGVFLSDVPLDENEGAKGDDLLAVDLPAGLDLDEFEIIEDLKPYREWCVPAALINANGSVSAAG
jgi:hypothetical protein